VAGALAVVALRADSGLAQSAIAAPQQPVAPAVGVRDSAGNATGRAIRLSARLAVDGRLDEEVYRSEESVSDFVQQAPVQGAPATERTEAWVLYDDVAIYVSAGCWDSAPKERWVANELRRDTNQLRQNRCEL